MNLQPSSYWADKGRYQAAAYKLDKLTPASGACANHETTNKHLDRYRRATNCYYDLFNNGLCNRGTEFRALFKVGRLPRKVGYEGRMTLDYDAIKAEGKVDERMDDFVLRAAKEQGIEV